MPDFLLELLTEEIPARMQARAAEQLAQRFGDGIKGQLPGGEIETFVTPRRLILFARGLGAQGNAVEEERRGPRADAPPQAIEGFLRGAGLTRDQLEERDTPKGKFLYATIRSEGRAAADVIAELVPQIVRDFDWPKSMRWGDASVSTASPRWVRPLSGIVALLDDTVVPFEAAGIASGRTTRGHRFMARAPIEITSAATYVAQLRDAHVLIDPVERATIIADGARAAASAAGLTLIEDAGLVAENAGLTEWPVPLLGRFDAAFLDVPREVIQLTMRTNQKYFACTDSAGALAPVFVCVAGLAAPDGGAAIVAGNQKVLAARLSDAKFFWDADLARVRDGGLASFTPKLETIVFHEKLGTLADKVDRVAKLARWLVESGAIPAPEGVADLAEQAARLCKADLVSATVGEFPEVQGIAGRYLALAEGLDPQVADAIRDHYKPVGQGDDVPTAPVSVAVALADKLDSLISFFGIDERPTGSRDPFALRRAGIALIAIVLSSKLRFRLSAALQVARQASTATQALLDERLRTRLSTIEGVSQTSQIIRPESAVLMPTHGRIVAEDYPEEVYVGTFYGENEVGRAISAPVYYVLSFLADRLKIQQRDAGIRPDIIDAVFALGGEDDLVRLLARVRALQAFIDTEDGANLLAGYRRAANILRIEEAKGQSFDAAIEPTLLTDPAEQALAQALDTTLATAATAVAAEAFEDAMTALATLRPRVDAFFDAVMVNDPDPAIRANRLNLLASFRAAVHSVADFSKIV